MNTTEPVLKRPKLFLEDYFSYRASRAQVPKGKETQDKFENLELEFESYLPQPRKD